MVAEARGAMLPSSMTGPREQASFRDGKIKRSPAPKWTRTSLKPLSSDTKGHTVGGMQTYWKMSQACDRQARKVVVVSIDVFSVSG